MRPVAFGVTANRSDILRYGLEPGPVAIRYTLTYELQQARIAEAMTIEEFNSLPGTPAWCTPDKPYSKSHALMLYRLGERIPAVAQDANRREQARHAAVRRARGR